MLHILDIQRADFISIYCEMTINSVKIRLMASN